MASASSIPGQHSRQEILSQGNAWAPALAAVQAQAAAIQVAFQKNTGRDLLFVACGSPYYLSLSAAGSAIASLGMRARAVPSSDLIFFAQNNLPPGPPPLTITLTRSGETSETAAAVRLMLKRGADVIAIGCDAGTTILKLAPVAIAIPEAQEVSTAQTKSFSAMLLAAQATLAVAGGNTAQLETLAKLPLLADAYVKRAWQATEAIIASRRIDRFFFLGLGPRFGLACEAMLKMKEMSISSAEAYHTLEFRHGPMSMVDEHTLVVGLISEEAAEVETAVLREMRALGGQTLAVGESAAALKDCADEVIAFESGLPPAARDLLYMPVVQSLAWHRAASKGIDCDHPRNLMAYITLPGIS